MIPRVALVSEEEPIVSKGEQTSWGLLLLKTVNGLLNRLGGMTGTDGVLLRDVTVAELAQITPGRGRMLFCTNEAGGAVPVFGDGTNWRRCTDRAIAS